MADSCYMPLHASLHAILQDHIVLPHVAAAGADITAAAVQVQAWKGGVPTGNSLSAVAVYMLPGGEPRTASFEARPLLLAKLRYKLLV